MTSTTPTPDRAECEAVVRRLWPYLDGALPETDQARVARHLEFCAGCASHFDFARAFLDAVARARAGAPQEEIGTLRARVLDALAAEGFKPEP
ncbi:MAG TPA: zf-HC2 domain-containing protein [Gemmatimonadaceae bacterium]|nr:zf-HC2 domain-containing protein [Gemmatimonadaceae bacterium]